MPSKLLIGTALMWVHTQVDLRLHLAGPTPLGRDILLGVLYSTSSYSVGKSSASSIFTSFMSCQH
jgi:hypothetical protein